jgi:hypothetical protein
MLVTKRLVALGSTGAFTANSAVSLTVFLGATTKLGDMRTIAASRPMVNFSRPTARIEPAVRPYLLQPTRLRFKSDSVESGFAIPLLHCHSRRNNVSQQTRTAVDHISADGMSKS